MVTNPTENNKRIVKNTIVLYFRMFFIMAIGLYTSRIVLEALGVVDFGIYNVVGGVVVMLGVLNDALSVSTQRYLTFEIGLGNKERLAKTFSACLTIYLALVLVFVLLAETVGLWFVNNKLTIPESRMTAANWVYQYTIISSAFNLVSAPYKAMVISNEKMNVFAYISILNALLKLGVVFLLLAYGGDKLEFYGLLMMLVFVIETMLYIVYCLRNYPETKYRPFWERGLFVELCSYSGWNIFGATSNVVKSQGLNILLNMFFNPAVNAARGIAVQVNGVVTQFFNNFFMSVRPQITKYYAQDDMANMIKLSFRSSKFAYYLILFVALPLCVEAPFLINLWLGQLPEYVVSFMRLIIVVTAIDSTSNPLMTIAHATGRIRLYQSVVGTLIMLNIPISYIFLHFGAQPDTVFWISIVISTIAFFVRIWIVNRLIDFPVWEYIYKVCGTILLVTLLATIPPMAILILSAGGALISVTNCVVCVLSTILAIYLVGLTPDERKYLTSFVRNKLSLKK